MQNQDFHGDPAELGINPEKLADLVSRAGKEVDEGLLPNAQVAMARQGQLVLFESFGSASNDSLFCIFSSTKAITSAAAWLLMQEGKLDISAPVASLVPEFGGNSSDKNDKRDKSDVTIEQLFTHTAGFPQAPFRPSEWTDKKRRMERFASWRLMWPPGSRYEYHPSSSMWVIAEIIERLSGMDFADFVRSRIAEPLGLPDMHLGAPDDVHGRVEDITIVGEPMTPEEYKALGMQAPPETEVTPGGHLEFQQASGAAHTRCRWRWHHVRRRACALLSGAAWAVAIRRAALVGRHHETGDNATHRRPARRDHWRNCGARPGLDAGRGREAQPPWLRAYQLTCNLWAQRRRRADCLG